MPVHQRGKNRGFFHRYCMWVETQPQYLWKSPEGKNRLKFWLTEEKVSRKTGKIDQNHNILWSSRKLAHRYMEGVAEQLSTLKNRLKTTENHNILWYGTNSAHRYMEERLKNWKSAEICSKTTICSGWTEIALIDIWKRWPHWEEELMNWWNLVWSSARSAAYQGWKTSR